MCINLKSDSAPFNSVFIGRFFNHVADTYANREEQRSRYNLLSSHRFNDNNYELTSKPTQLSLADFFVTWYTYTTLKNI